MKKKIPAIILHHFSLHPMGWQWSKIVPLRRLTIALIWASIPLQLLGQGIELNKYTPDESVWHPALLRRAHDTSPKEWTNLAGKTFTGVLVHANDAEATFLAEKKRFVVPVSSFMEKDRTLIREEQERWSGEAAWLQSTGEAWRSDPGLLIKSLESAIKNTPGLLAPKKPITPTTDAITVGISVQDPSPAELLSLLRPLFGEKVLFQMNFVEMTKERLVFGQAKGLSGVIDTVVSQHSRTISDIRPDLVCDIDITTTERRHGDWRSVKRGTTVACAGVISGTSFGAIRYRGIDFPYVVLKISDATPIGTSSSAEQDGRTQNLKESFDGMPVGVLNSQGEWSTRYKEDEPAKAELRSESGNTFLSVPESVLRSSSVSWRLFEGEEATNLSGYSKVRWGGRFRRVPTTSSSSIGVQVSGLNKQWDLDGFTIKGFKGDSRWLEFRSDWAPIDRTVDAGVWIIFGSPHPGAYHVDDLFVEFQ